MKLTWLNMHIFGFHLHCSADFFLILDFPCVPTHTWHAVPSTLAVSSAMLFRCFECIVTLSRVHSWHCCRPPALFIIKCTSHKGRDDLCKCLVMAADSWSEGSLCWTITEHRVKVLSVIVSSYIIQCNLLKLPPASCFFRFTVMIIVGGAQLQKTLHSLLLLKPNIQLIVMKYWGNFLILPLKHSCK